MPDPNLHLHDTDDASVWAEAFVQTVKDNDLVVDEDLMLSWFANAIETGKDRLTVKQLIDRAISRAQVHEVIQRHKVQDLALLYGTEGEDGSREFLVAITKLEEAQMWFTRGMAIATGKFNPADLEKADA